MKYAIAVICFTLAPIGYLAGQAYMLRLLFESAGTIPLLLVGSANIIVFLSLALLIDNQRQTPRW